MLEIIIENFPVIIATLLVIVLLVVIIIVRKNSRRTSEKSNALLDFDTSIDEMELDEGDEYEESLIRKEKFQALSKSSSFDEKLEVADEQTKRAYAIVTDALMSCGGIKIRCSKKAKSFKLDGENFAKIVFSGKTLKLYLAIDPATVSEKRYRHQDASRSSIGKELPTLLKLRNSLMVRRAVELIKNSIEPKTKTLG